MESDIEKYLIYLEKTVADNKLALMEISVYKVKSADVLDLEDELFYKLKHVLGLDIMSFHVFVKRNKITQLSND
jgi:hypothetical protein